MTWPLSPIFLQRYCVILILLVIFSIVFLYHNFFKTKQLISLLEMLLIDNMQVKRSGSSSLCWLSWLLQNYGLLQFRVLKQKPCQCLVQVELNDFIYTCKSSKFMSVLGFHFMCWMSGVVQFNKWLISSWEENECCYKLRKCTKWHLFHSKWLKLSFCQLLSL